MTQHNVVAPLYSCPGANCLHYARQEPLTAATREFGGWWLGAPNFCEGSCGLLENRPPSLHPATHHHLLLTAGTSKCDCKCGTGPAFSLDDFLVALPSSAGSLPKRPPAQSIPTQPNRICLFSLRAFFFSFSLHVLTISTTLPLSCTHAQSHAHCVPPLPRLDRPSAFSARRLRAPADASWARYATARS